MTQPALNPQPRLKSDAKPAWLYAEALKEEKLVGYFLKALIDDRSGRNANLRLALNHGRMLLSHIEALVDQEQEA